MDVRTFTALLSADGQALLAEVADCAGIESDLALGTRLRREHDADLVAAAVTQNHLRHKASPKFGSDAARMYFTHDALEQSTRASVSAHRASRLVAAGVKRVVDLGCGIGGDLIAFARAGMETRGVELDPVRALISQANLVALGLPGRIECTDATALKIGADETAFIDPARRSARGRTFNPKDFEPSWEFATAMLAAGAVVKTMPGIAHRMIPEGAEAEWVSDGGSLVEACLWSPRFATARHRATLLPTGATLTEADDPGAAPHGGVGAVIYEPDDAVIRAGLVTAVAAQVGGWLLDEHIAYVSANAFTATSFARTFEVLAELPFREKALKAALKDRDIGELTIKKRGVDITPDALLKRLRLKGEERATVIMTRVQGQARAFLVDPIVGAPDIEPK